MIPEVIITVIIYVSKLCSISCAHNVNTIKYTQTEESKPVCRYGKRGKYSSNKISMGMNKTFPR